MSDVSVPPGEVGISRRWFLTATGAVVASGLAADACSVETRNVLLSRHQVSLPGLPAALDGIKIAQVSDVHVPANRAATDRTLAILEVERPEIVLLTGDQCETTSAVNGLVEFVRAARGSVATIAILGNWDYRGHTVGLLARRAYEQAGATLLVNEHAIVDVRGARLAFVGLDDMLSSWPNAAAALAGLPLEIPAIWTIHEPAFADYLTPAPAQRPAFVLAGHTHGGQIRIPGLPPFLPPGSGRFLEGWYTSTLGRLYVSRGIGTADVRARFRCPPELPIFVLRRGGAAQLPDQSGR